MLRFPGSTPDKTCGYQQLPSVTSVIPRSVQTFFRVMHEGVVPIVVEKADEKIKEIQERTRGFCKTL